MLDIVKRSFPAYYGVLFLLVLAALPALGDTRFQVAA
jgi:hypothetical protein